VARRSREPFPDAVKTLLAERSISLRALARQADIDVAHLSRLLSGAYPRDPSDELVARVARAFDLPAEYFAEARTTSVVEKVKADPKLRDRLYDELAAKPKRRRRRSS
jgi:transcriptional regulator with XRE-family HTH domain